MDTDTTKQTRIERTFTSETEATRYWNRKPPAGLTPIINELQYNKNRTYTVLKVFEKAAGR